MAVTTNFIIHSTVSCFQWYQTKLIRRKCIWQHQRNIHSHIVYISMVAYQVLIRWQMNFLCSDLVRFQPLMMQHHPVLWVKIIQLTVLLPFNLSAYFPKNRTSLLLSCYFEEWAMQNLDIFNRNKVLTEIENSSNISCPINSLIFRVYIFELPHDKTKKVASAQSDQSLRCVLNG